MKICKTCPVNTVSKKEGLGKCKPCEVGEVANLDRTNCGEFELRCYIFKSISSLRFKKINHVFCSQYE